MTLSKAYQGIWIAFIGLIAILAVAGMFTGWSVVAFGFLTFGLIYFGMMFVLPYNAGHPQTAEPEPQRIEKAVEKRTGQWAAPQIAVDRLHFR